MSDFDEDWHLYHYYINTDIASLNQHLYDRARSYNLEHIKYLLTSSSLTMHPEIHHDNDRVFYRLLRDEDKEGLEIINYLIFDYKIEKTPAIEKILTLLDSDFNKKVYNMFEMRELNQSLSKELPSLDSMSKRIKV